MKARLNHFSRLLLPDISRLTINDIPGIESKQRFSRGLTLILMLFVIVTGSLNATTINVPGTYSTIQAAINGASNGDVINVGAGTYTENLAISKALTITGAGAASTFITSANPGSAAIVISSDNVTVSGFTISNQTGKQGIYVANHSNISITNNIITNIGSSDASVSGTNLGITVVSSTVAVDLINITGNTISNIVGGNNKSADGLIIGFSTGNFNITNLTIQNNTISTITTSFDPTLGKGAYGILLNHAVAPATGQTINPVIENNSISTLVGLWAHGIGLEGNTPGALIQGNNIDNLADHKNPTDAAGVNVEDNPSAGAVTLSSNSFTNVNLGILNQTNTPVILGAANTYNGTNIPNMPALTNISPANGAVGVSITPTIWYDPETVSGETVTYLVNIASDINFTNIVYSNSNTSTTQTVPSGILSYSTVYYLKVEAVSNTTHSVTISGGSFTTQPPAPTLLTPANTLTGVSILPDFSWTWTGIGSVNNYVLTIKDGATVLFTKTFTTTTPLPLSYQLLETDITPVLSNNHVYTWTVTATQGANTSTATGTFTTAQSAAATLSTPGSGSMVYSYTPVEFSWYFGQAIGSLTFQVQYLKNSDLIVGHSVPQANDWAAGTTVITPAVKTSSFSINTESLLAGTKYWWRVITYRGSEVLSYSSASGQSFTTSGGTTAAEAIPSWPVGGTTVYTNAPTLYWYTNNADLTGITFDITISKNSNLSSPVSLTNATGLTNLYYDVVPNLAPGTTYYWAVTTHGTGDVNSITSSIQSFITNGVGTVLLPVLTYPINITIYDQSPTFYWYLNSATSGITYKVFVDGNLDGSVSDVFSYTTSSILAPGTHTWYVKATNGNVTQDQTTATSTFTIAGGITQGLPIASWPIGSPTVYTTMPTLSWYVNGSTIGLQNFVVAWNTTNLGPNGNWQSLAQTPGTSGTNVNAITSFSYDLTNPQALTYGQTYYWAVASYDGSNYSTWSVGQFTITGSTGSPVPIVSYPNGGGLIYSTSATLSWYINGATSNIDHYRVVYSRRADMDESDATNTTIVNSVINQYIDVINLVPGSTYYWKVGSSPNGSDPVAYSNIATFVVAPTTSSSNVVPLVGSPKNGVGITTLSPLLSWVLPTKTSGSLIYELEYSNNPKMSDSTIISGIKEPSKIVNGLAADKVYYWRVRSVDGNGQTSAFSEIGQFSVKSVTSVDNNKNVIPKEFLVSQNYPNPFNPSTIISYALPKASFVSIKIYNMLGQEVKTLASGENQAGTYKVQWDGDNNSGLHVASGAYIYRVVAGQYVKTMKMLLLK